MSRAILFIILATFSIITDATLPNDPIQRCLDVRRYADFTNRQKMAAKEPGVLRFKFHKVSPRELPPALYSGGMDEVIRALTNQLKNCRKKYAEFKVITIAHHSYKRQEWCEQTSLKMLELAKASQGDYQQFLTNIKSAFDWYKSEGWPENHSGFKRGDFQFTAYYAPAPIEAHSKKGGGFTFPIYSNPGVISASLEAKRLKLKTPLCGVDPLTHMMHGYCLKNPNGSYSVVPNREEIEKGALHPKYIIGYVKDPNDPAFLMVQGAGSLILDGQQIHVNYDGYNGRPRTMLGRIVQCAQDPTCGGNLDTMERCAHDPKCHDEAKLRCNVSKEIKQSAGNEKLIRMYLDNPLNRDKADNLRNRDQSYVFFAKTSEGPYGSENIILTPHASCATDHKVIPIGMSFIYNCKNATSWCVAQDAGGAIVGAHVDLYKGEGVQAGREANAVNHSGTLYVALPKRK